MKTFRTARLSALAMGAFAASLATAQTHPVAPGYSSNPGATYTLYLDFSGFTYPGTWDNHTPGSVPAFDIDGDASSFSAAENSAVANAWAAVAQKHVGFNVNVTTVDPYTGSTNTDAARKSFYDSQAHLMHTVIGGRNSWYVAGTGGVSYVGVTQSAFPNPQGQATEYHTNWVFPQNLGNSSKKHRRGRLSRERPRPRARAPDRPWQSGRIQHEPRRERERLLRADDGRRLLLATKHLAIGHLNEQLRRTKRRPGDSPAGLDGRVVQ